VGAGGRAARWHGTGWTHAASGKGRLNFLLCCRCCQAPWRMFFSSILWTLCHMAPIGLAASCGVGTSRLQRPSIRAGSHTRHPMLSASFDKSRKACRRRPHLSDGFFRWPGNITGRLHQHPGQSLMQHRKTPSTSLRAAPAGTTPVSRQRHSAIRNFRATATIPRRLTRFPPPPQRSRNPPRSARSSWSCTPLPAHSVVIQRTCRLPALVMPCSRALSPL
jgi:hypothetical protein